MFSFLCFALGTHRLLPCFAKSLAHFFAFAASEWTMGCCISLGRSLWSLRRESGGLGTYPLPRYLASKVAWLCCFWGVFKTCFFAGMMLYLFWAWASPRLGIHMMMCGGLRLTLQHLDKAQLAAERGRRTNLKLAVAAAERSLKLLGPLVLRQRRGSSVDSFWWLWMKNFCQNHRAGSLSHVCFF